MSLLAAILIGWIVSSFVLGPLALCLVDEDSRPTKERPDWIRRLRRRNGAVRGLPLA